MYCNMGEAIQFMKKKKLINWPSCTAPKINNNQSITGNGTVRNIMSISKKQVCTTHNIFFEKLHNTCIKSATLTFCLALLNKLEGFTLNLF